MSGETDNNALKQYKNALETIETYLLKHSENRWYLGDFANGETSNRMQHFACFAGGMFALGAKHTDKPEFWLEKAVQIGDTCRESYASTATNLGPDSFRVQDGRIELDSTEYLLRPEVVETYFYLWRYTKDQRWRDYGWEFALALESHCRTEGGFSGLNNVNVVDGGRVNRQQSWFLAETLKYLFLLFSDDDVLPLEDWVFNTEAHPIKIRK